VLSSAALGLNAGRRSVAADSSAPALGDTIFSLRVCRIWSVVPAAADSNGRPMRSSTGWIDASDGI